jgi:hypothetical protein
MKQIKVSLYTRESATRRYVKSKRSAEYPSTTTWALRYGSTWETLKVNSLAAATSERIQRELDLLRRWSPTTQTAPVREAVPILMLDRAIDQYLGEIEAGRKPKTFAAYRVSLRYFFASCLNKPLSKVDRADLLKFSAFSRDTKEQAPRSTYNKFDALMTFLKHFDITGKSLKLKADD